MSTLQEVVLPNGVSIWAANRFEALLLFQEIVRDHPYDKHGITLDDGAVVFDIGANIGMYALHLATTVPGVRVHCFEPIPFLFEALQRNLAAHVPGAIARDVGLSAAEGEATFTVDRYATVTATRYPEVFAPGNGRTAALGAWAEAGLSDFDRVEASRLTGWLRRGLARPSTRPLTIAALFPFAAFLECRKRLFLRRYRCTLETVSAALAQSGRAGVDLMKIDVEGAEEDVLNGIAARDWEKIRQLVIEVHDVDGRRDRMGRRLAEAGYRVTHDREPWAIHELLGISTIYAVR